MTDKSVVITDIIDNLRRVFQILNEQSKKVEKDTGLTGPQLWTIKVICENAPINLSDLSRRLYLHPTTVGGIIDRLETRKLVRRTRAKEDRRVVRVELTPAGQLLVKSAPQVAQGLLVAGLEELPIMNLKDINKSMKNLVKIFGAQKTPPKLIRSVEINYPVRKTSAERSKGSKT
ncbi:MAG: MarR family transcriptional regulator [Deltaproteobacteria bacterium HGW-Deltaproteobacteria-6]|jgi:DNA-binding MarR family transcriptional regulator|nr:MAG: MarR family transcriptional regulator [Deltaproteobacteria bacterium HGW-Deltaproteobacteria-6]PKN96808.1 MAG: MarR family transcriptional regulator [Chloroflexi bacterium HGW-Chloroflexi-5]